MKVLQQVAVIARHLGDQAAGRQAEPADHGLGIPLRVRHPRVGVRREVRVVREDVLAGYVGGELHEQARFAKPYVQRIKVLGASSRSCGDVALAERGHSQVDESMRKVGAAQATFRQQQHLPRELSVSGMWKNVFLGNLLADLDN